MMRCPGCPVAGLCVAEWTAHRPYCDWAARGGRPRDRVIELSALGPEVQFAGPSPPRPVTVDYGTAGPPPAGRCCG